MSSWARLFVLGRKSRSLPLVNVVELEGAIASAGGNPAALRRGISLARVDSWLVKAFSTALRPSAVAININSPGGSAVQSDLIHRRIRTLSQESKIPVFTYAQDYAASGLDAFRVRCGSIRSGGASSCCQWRYWLMCAGDQLVACSTSIVGSIGVIAGSFGAPELLKRAGLERRVYTAGKNKVLMDPFSPETEEGKAKLLGIITDVHESFKDLVKTSRGQALKGNPDELFSGAAWTGRQAKDLGLIDEIGDMRSHLCAKFGPQTVFRLCSDRPRAALFGPSLPFGKLGSGLLGGYDLVRDASSAVLDELEERALKARLGM